MVNYELAYGKSPVFLETMIMLDKYSKTDWPILIQGETGTGKELLARRAHLHSNRNASSFFALNCVSIASGLFESEFFGHEKGAFSGAISSYKGILKQASGGTLFLDEIGDLNLELQAKLLRFLDGGEVRAVGSSRVEKIDVRIVAATHVDLCSAVGRGKFRQDLWERLNILRVQVPALRERKEDIPIIAAEWLRMLNVSVSSSDLTILADYAWPGNIRQLRNLLIRGATLYQGKLNKNVFLELIEEEKKVISNITESSIYLQGTLADIEKAVITTRLKKMGGNVKRTAEILNIAKSTLHEKLKKWKLENTTYEHAEKIEQRKEEQKDPGEEQENSKTPQLRNKNTDLSL